MLKVIRLFNCICLTAFCVLTFSCKDNDHKNNQAENKSTNIDSTKIKELVNSYKNGQVSFNKLCNHCHYSPEKNVTDQYLFDNLFDRLPKPAEEYFIKFIDDSKNLKKQQDSYALKLSEIWNTNFEHNFKDSLTIQDKSDIIVFIKVAARQKAK